METDMSDNETVFVTTEDDGAGGLPPPNFDDRRRDDFYRDQGYSKDYNALKQKYQKNLRIDLYQIF